MANFAFQFVADHEQLEARLTVVPNSPEMVHTREELDRVLLENHVTAGIDEDVIESAFERLYNIEEPGEVFVIARGRKVEHGQNGSIEFKVDVSGEATYHGKEELGEKGKIDFREATHIITVDPGDVIAEAIPPTDGEDGVSLSGKPLPAHKGTPASLRPGEGVEADAEARFFKATRQGRPLYDAGTITVSPIFEVSGDVDFNTGNIKFEGHVIVHGSVQDGFAIEAKSAEFRGTVGACTVKSEGDVTIHGGVNGREKAELHVGGNLTVKYMNQSQAVVLGNLTVSREIVNSKIWCRGEVRAGKIMGGECLALGGVDVAFLGSELGVYTVIEPGCNFEARKIEEKLAEVDEELEALLRPIQPFFGDRRRFKALADEKKQAFRNSYLQFNALKEKHLELSTERNRILSSEEFQPVKQVIVRKIVYPDVFVRTDMASRGFKKQVTGPVVLTEDIDNATIRSARYVPGKGAVEEEGDD